MQSINTLSQTSTVIDWLKKSQRPRVLHVFDQVCNLINGNRDVLSVVTPEIGNGPFNLVVDGIVFSDHIDQQSDISISPGQLTLGDLTINTTHGELWSPSPNWDGLHARRKCILNLVTSLSSAITRPLLPDSLTSGLSLAMARADISSARSVTSQLAGLGMGLTPAGDDFIMGAVYAAWILHPLEVAGTLAREIAKIGAPLTTSLSAAWLRSAGRGEAGILWHEFFDTLCAGQSEKPVGIHATMVKILSVGETSGADALAGFLGTLVASTEIPY